MKTEYEEIITGDGLPAISFSIHTKKGQAYGIFGDNRIWVHGIYGEGSVKGIMNILINRFNTNKVTFTPLINDNVKNSIRGELKILPKEDKLNPYGEDINYLECEWKK